MTGSKIEHNPDNKPLMWPSTEEGTVDGEFKFPDHELGLYKKYSVKRLRDHKGKHDQCEYFVLDLNHDRHALTALAAYAEACRLEYPFLSKDLDDTLDVYRRIQSD